MACHQMGSRRHTIRNLSSMTSTPLQPNPSPAAWLLDDDDAAASSGHHFLDECRMCGCYLPRNRDIYMYKGDTPFCSEDCRDQQIRMDELQESANRRRRHKAAAATSGSSRAHAVKSRAASVAVAAV